MFNKTTQFMWILNPQASASLLRWVLYPDLEWPQTCLGVTNASVTGLHNVQVRPRDMEWASPKCQEGWGWGAQMYRTLIHQKSLSSWRSTKNAWTSPFLCSQASAKCVWSFPNDANCDGVQLLLPRFPSLLLLFLFLCTRERYASTLPLSNSSVHDPLVY